MKRMIRIACLISISMICFTSCKKDEKTRMELITAGNWKLVSDQEKTGTGAWQENIQTYSQCELDNYIKFNANNTFEYNEGPTKCDPMDAQSETAAWAFQNDESSINIYGEALGVEELSGSILILTSSDTFGGTTTYYKQVFNH